MPNPFPKAIVDIQEREIPRILKSFSLFLGGDKLARRIEIAEKMVAAASPTYRARFVRPRQFLWLGTRELLELLHNDRLRGEFMSPTAIAALHHIASIRKVLHTMPAWKKKEFRSRLIDKGGGDIPALIEIAAASRIVTLGGEIKWMAERVPGERVFEMLGSYKGEKFEVECKAKTVDAGRQLARGALYQFADRLKADPAYSDSKQPRYVTLTMDGRFPTNLHDQSVLKKAMDTLLQSEGSTFLADGSMISVESVSAEQLKIRATVELEEFEHRLVSSELVVSFRSRKPDQMIASIEKDLRDALKQFSGNLPALVVCYVPEVESFAGTQEPGTALFALVYRFLSRADARNIVSLSFFSDPKIDTRSNEIEAGLPSVRFCAKKFRGSHLEIF